MFTRPDEPTDRQLVAAVRDGWGLRAEDVAYVPVGFGSYHWRMIAEGTQWFVTVDDLELCKQRRGDPVDVPLRCLTAALTTAVALREAGLDFVIAPALTDRSDCLVVMDNRFALALYPYVDGTPHRWGQYASSRERLAVLDLVTRIHAASGTPREVALADDLAIPARDELTAALRHLDSPWDTGPYGDDTRRRLQEHAEAVHQVLARFDELVAETNEGTDRWVVTHGEPHRANTIDTETGLVLIDWDTARLAAPERDLWMLADGDPAILDAYSERTGIPWNRTALDTYRLWWDLTEVALYIAQFRKPHEDNEDTQTAWQGIVTHLDPARW
jgi:spectinomycin phosphotransferase